MKRDRELELEAELELSLLQINQLQEELEYYYLECSRLKEQEAEYSSAPSQIPAQVLLTESRVSDSRYSESGFYAKGKSLLSQISQLKQALESSTKEKAELESGGRDLEFSLSKSQAALASSTKEKADLESDGRDLESALSESQAALESSLSEKAMLEKQVSDTGAERDREAHGHQENKKLAENLQCQVEQLTVDLKEGSRSVALGQKMLAKSQVDLDHLRNSYAEKVASEQELAELVNELLEKLTVASRYYFDLQKEHPEILLPAKNI